MDFNIKGVAVQSIPNSNWSLGLTAANTEVGLLTPGQQFSKTFVIGSPQDPSATPPVFPTPQDALDYYFANEGPVMVAAYNTFSGLSYVLGSLTTIDAATWAEIESKEATTQVTADIASAVATLENSAPGSLDTLGEIDTKIASDETTLANKVDKISGKSLSTNDYSSTEQSKLSGEESSATFDTHFYYKGVAKTGVLPLCVQATVGASGAVTFDLTQNASGGSAAFSEVYPETSNITSINGIPFQPSSWTVSGDLKSIAMVLKQPGTVGILGGALSYLNVASGTVVNLNILGKSV